MEETLNFLLSQATGGGQLRRNREQMIANLNKDDEAAQMQALFQLCDELNMASPIGLTMMQPGQLVEPIIGCLKKVHNPDLALLAARALTYLADSLPQTLLLLAESDNVNALLDPLRNMTEIELSEQCLTCLEKLSQIPEGARAIFQEGGIGALLMFIDFFTIGSQRKAWSCVQRACRSVNEKTFSSVEDLLPAIRQAASHSDLVIRESALVALTTIARGVHRSDACVTTIFQGLDDTLAASTSPHMVKPDTLFTAVLSLLHVGIHSSAAVTKALIEGGVMRNLFAWLDVFVGTDDPASPLGEAASGSPTRSRSVSQSTSPALRFAEGPSPSFDTAAPQATTPASGANRAANAPVRPSSQQVAAMTTILANVVGSNRQGLLAYTDTLQLVLRTTTTQFNAGWPTAAPPETDGASSRQEGSEEEEETDGDDDDSWVEEADQDEPAVQSEEADAEALKRREHVAASGVPLQVTKQHVTVGNHICDGCQKSNLKAGDWYRCNQCRDADYCADCVEKQWKKHAGGNHTFTDVAVLLGAQPLQWRCRASRPSVNEEAKTAMFKAHPTLMMSLLDGLHTMINLATEAESVQVVLPTTNFIASLCEKVSAAQLSQCHLENSQIHDLILAQLASHRLWANLLGVSLLSVLLEKLGDVMTPKLMREGVTDGLLQLRTSLQGKDSPAVETAPSSAEWPTKLTTIAGWKEAIAEACSQCLARFPALKDEKRAANLQRVSTLLKEGHLDNATALLGEVLKDGTTTFELSSGTIVKDLREAFTRADSIEAVMQFMVKLSSISGLGSEPTALFLLVQHLQSMQNRLDGQLQADTAAETAQGTVTLRLAPHESATSPKSKTAATSGSAPGAPQGIIASVSVDPFVTIGELAEFVEQNLVNRNNGQSTMARARRHLMNRVDEEESDGVENILPDLHSTVKESVRGKSFREAVSPAGTRASAGAGGAGDSTPSTRPTSRDAADETTNRYWIRYGQHVLPPSMTVLQVLERFSRSTLSRDRSASAGMASRSDAAARRQGNEDAAFFYSAVPFGDGFKIVPGAARIPALSVSSPSDVRVPSALQGPASAAQTLAALANRFVCSKRFITAAHQEVLCVLGMLHTALTHWAELLRFTHPDLASGATTSEAILSPHVPLSMFESHKLNHKALRLSCNLRMAGMHTANWPVNLELDVPFLFPAATRELFFNVAFCGTTRSLVRMQQYARKHGGGDRFLSAQSARSQHQLAKSKKRVWRDHPLECAMAILGDRRSSGAVAWEFQFYHEEGSGLGPTREFYTLVSQALRKRSLNLWLTDSNEGGGSRPDELLSPLHGLFPRPLAADCPQRAELARYFSFMGRFVARALLDGHVPMLALSPVFLKLVRGDICGLSDVELLQPSVHHVLQAMTIATSQQTPTLALGKDGCTVESLFLVFTLPGDDAVELVPGGAQREVTAANMSEYCDLVVDCLLNGGVRYAVEAFRAGFDDYMPVSALRALTVGELQVAIHGHEQPVTRAELEAYCKADHGFIPTCKHVQWFYDIVASFPLEDQQKFFQFLTGSPHLPVGGLASLRPPLTIVRKVASDQSVMEGEQLPSAMTCQNYLKLPGYETKEQMEQKLRQAMEEGTGAFLLT